MASKRPAVPKAMRQEIWKRDMGNVIEGKCPVPWCTNTVSFTTFVLAHNVPFSRGGATDASNLCVTCASCNLGMGDRMTVTEWGAQMKRGTASAYTSTPPLPAHAPTPTHAPAPAPAVVGGSGWCAC